MDRPDEVRRVVNFKRLAITEHKVDVPRLAKKKVLAEALASSGALSTHPYAIVPFPGRTAWARRLCCEPRYQAGWRAWEAITGGQLGGCPHEAVAVSLLQRDRHSASNAVHRCAAAHISENAHLSGVGCPCISIAIHSSCADRTAAVSIYM